LQQTNGSLSFPFSICSKQTKVAIFNKLRFPFALRNKNYFLKRYHREIYYFFKENIRNVHCFNFKSQISCTYLYFFLTGFFARKIKDDWKV
jgi:hypothetical protein